MGETAYDPYAMFRIGGPYGQNLSGVSGAYSTSALGTSTPIAGYPTFDQWNGNMATNPTGGGFSPTPPSVGGVSDSWFDMKGKGGMALGGVQLGLGAFNSWMGLKNQKFMQDYYGKQQALQMADFGNNAKMANLGLENRMHTTLSNRGIDPNSDAGKTQMADYMNKWKVKETL